MTSPSIALFEQLTQPQPRLTKPIIDKVETPIIACNDNFNLQTGRIRRPSTPNKVASKIGSAVRKGRDDKKQGSRIRSASAGRDHKTEVSSRYWTYLFENLERSISEIYEGCEKEENIRQCKEVILILENYTRDFTKLIEWFHLKWSYEKTPPPMRPQALAWEIRKPSLCLLPHTRAYEILLGLRESKQSPNSSCGKINPSLEAIGSTSNCNLRSEQACVVDIEAESKGPSLPSAVIPNPAVTNRRVSDSDLTTNTNETTETYPLSSYLTVDIGLQTDLEEDPDIFYFAGGRTVGLQTNYLEEYGPLSPILFKSMPAILVLNTSPDSDFDTAPGLTHNNASTVDNACYPVTVTPSTKPSCANNKTHSNSGQNNVESINALSTPVALLLSHSSPVAASETPVHPSHLMPISTSGSCINPTTPIETKSSSTQLSAGVLIADETPFDKEFAQAANVMTITMTTSLPSSSVPCAGDKSQCSSANTSTPTRSTFAEKAKNGMLRQSQAIAKSVSSYLNKVGTVTGNSNPNISATTSGTRPLLSKDRHTKTASTAFISNRDSRSTVVLGGLKSSVVTGNNSGLKGRIPASAPVIPNYRSNIASRCRTAVNTGIPQPENQQSSKQSTKDKTINKASSSWPLSSLSAAAESSVSKASSYAPSPSANSKSTQEQLELSKSKPSAVPRSGISNVENATRKDDFNASSIMGLGQQQHMPTVSFSTCKPAGIIRSKSMINPFPTGGAVRRSDGTKEKSNGPKRTNSTAGVATGMKASGSFKRLHSNSYVSLPDETTCQKKSHMIDAEGWETVKTRSSRAKWSSSNSSLGSSNANRSRNSLDKGTPQKTELVSAQSTPTVSLPSGINNTRKSPGINSRSSLENNQKPKSTSKSKKSGGEPKNKVSDTNDKCVRKREEENKSPVCPAAEDDGVLDYEAIKKKEADLDDAIREEELIEEELRQVEKDFERIENDSTTEEGTITDSETAISPEVVDFDEMDDQFFFVSIDDQESANVEDMPPREPGRILSLREKLMSPAKKADGAETLKRYEAKLAKAERNREKLLQAKFNRYVELSDRFESLNETTKRLVAERAELILKAEGRRKRAGEKRQEYIKNIQRKAHDEDSKAKEIAFINLLEAQNKRHDYFASAQEVEGRLQTIQDERRLRLEETSGKSSAVILRQSKIRKDWQIKLTVLQEKRRIANERVTREKEERAKERSEIAQEKARDREVRISALNAAKQAEKEELQKKIKQKQEETARRHEENMEQIRQKAAELGAPRPVQEENAAPSSYRVCTLCSVLIQSGIHEMQHIRSRSHLDAVKNADKSSSTNVVELSCGLGEGFGFKFIADVQADKIDAKVQPDRNRNKALKKHSKKLMQKLMETGLEFEKSIKDGHDSKKAVVGDPIRIKTRKNILELDRLISLFANNKGSPNIATSIDRIMAGIRKTSVQNIYMQDAIIGMNGLEVALKVLQCQAVDLPAKSKIHAIEMIHGFILDSLTNGLYILRGTGICILMNLCSERWSTLIPDDNRWLCSSPLGANESLPTDHFIQSVIELLFNVLDYIPNPFKGIFKKGSFLTQDEIQSIKIRTSDIIGYLVASGVVDRISVYCSGIRGPVDEQPAVALLLRVFIDFLVLLVYTLQFCWGENPAGCVMQKNDRDETQLLAALEASELAGAVSMSYSLLLHQGAPTRPRAVDGNADKLIPPPPGEKTAEVVKSTLCLINAMARLNLQDLQNVLASEAVSLQFRHIASQLLWQVVPNRQSILMRRLLTELIISIGNFTVGNKHNQSTIQSGQTPTVLQLLCTLPQEYFVDPKFKHNFIPTLLAATQGCPENRNILVQNNVDLNILDDYLISEEGKKNVFVRRMIFVTSQQSPSTSIMATATGQKGANTKKVKQHKKSVLKANVKPLEESNNVVK